MVTEREHWWLDSEGETIFSETNPMKLAIFISGRGSNLQALIDACARTDFPAEIVVVASNKAEAGGLAKAKRAGLPQIVVDHKQFDDRTAFEANLLEKITPYQPDLICLAGFMRLLSSYFVEQWHNKIINIHPSLLPLYKGLDTHARALADGAKETGCTVHFVSSEMDSGPIIVQKKVPVFPHDDENSLAERVLTKEHEAYPEAVRAIASGDVLNIT